MNYRIALIVLITFCPCIYAEEPTISSDAVAILPRVALKPTTPNEMEGTIAQTENGWKLDSPKKLDKSYNLSVSHDFMEPIAQDQVCLFVIKARTISSERPDGKGRVTAAVQNKKNYQASALWREWIVGKDWETTFFAFQAQRDIPAGAGVAKINVGEAKQIIEIADIQLYRFPLGFDVFHAPQMIKTYGGRELDAPWRKDAEARIAKLRRGNMNVVVEDASGKPIEGAKIHVAMKRHLFGFGSAVDVNMLSGLGSTISAADQQKYLATTDELFSRVVPENGLRVGNIDSDPNPEKPWETDSRRRTRIAMEWTLQWAKDKRMTSRGHYLTWGYLEDWASEEIKKGGPNGLLNRYDRHFKHVLPFCAPYVDEWDAINHPVPFVEKDALYNVVGPDVYPDLYARIRPQTDKLLFVNEDNFNTQRTDAFESHVKHMIAKGVQPDGCGFQSHFSDYSIPSIEEELGVYNRFGRLVKLLTVTEYDFQTLDDQLHADHMRDMLTLCFSHPQMTGFVIWGFWETRHWKPTAAMFKADWTERPAVQVWRDLVKTKWWTEGDFASDSKGLKSLPAYFGWYDIHVEHNGQKKTIEFKHTSSGSKALVVLD